MVKRVTTALLAAALGAGALATAPAYADTTPTSPTPSGAPQERFHHVDPSILSFQVSPNPVVVKRHGSVKVTATVRTKDVSGVYVEFEAPGGGWGHRHTLRQTGVAPQTLSWQHTKTFTASQIITWSQPTGVWKVRVKARGVNGRWLTEVRTFVVKHDAWRPRPPKGPKATRITGFDASPEPAHRGQKLTLKGRLQVATCYGYWHYPHWNSLSSVYGGHCHGPAGWFNWHSLGGQDIDVYFRPSGSHHWKYVDTVETRRDGSFSTKVRTFKSGTWRVKFDGTRVFKGAKAEDYVKVYR